MKVFILITAVIELIAGILLFVQPGLIPELDPLDPMTVTLARMYGGAALAIGYYALLVWKHMNTGAVNGFLKIFTFFHALVALACHFGYSNGLESFLGAAILHGVLCLATGYFWVMSTRQEG